MNTIMSFEKVKETFLTYAPQLLHTAVSTGSGCVMAHLAALDNICKWWHAEYPEYKDCRSPATVMWKEAMKEIRRTVASWDVRMVGDLVALVPHAFPAWVAQGRYGIELGDCGWFLMKAA